MRFERLLELVDAVAKSGLTSFEYQEGDTRIVLSNDKTGGAAGQNTGSMSVAEERACHVSAENREIAIEAGTAAALELVSAEGKNQTNVPNPSGQVVASPLVGTFYAAPSEEAEVYVKIGDRVKKGQTLAIVEAMKLMNEIECDYDGIVEEILVQNGQGVEYGQPLFRIA